VVRAGIDVLPDVRREVAAWLVALGAGPADVDLIQLVVSELAANAVEASEPGEEVSVGMAQHDAAVSIEVLNPSRRTSSVAIPAMADPMAARGRGLAIVSALADEVSLAEVDGHTVARCSVPLVDPRGAR
jgi:anti-sigma regulatory factor (Ser/Thr protein kinase)